MSQKQPQHREDSAVNELSNFIEIAREQGFADEIIYQSLKNRGWSTEDIESAFAIVIEKLTGVSIPLPQQPGGESSREAFLYLLSFVTLGIWSQALGSIGFIAVNRWLEDSLTNSYSFYRLSSSLARLIVVYPIYLLLMKLLTRNLTTHPENYQSGVRKWLTYLALFITALIVIGNLVWFLTSFLTGSLTLRFICKSLIVLIIAGGIFCYYLTWLQRQPLRS